jgi:hypothetical protein
MIDGRKKINIEVMETITDEELNILIGSLKKLKNMFNFFIHG